MATSTDMESLHPSEEGLSRIEKRYRVFSKVVWALTRPLANFTQEGAEQVPKKGPVLVLANHVSAYDAPAINILLGRPVIYLASEGLVGRGFKARFLAGLGVIPKKKFTSDARAVRALKGWTNNGAAVGLFPEGERSWDGQTLSFVPGIEKLVRLIGAPVVTARIQNADRVYPRWAQKVRKGRVHFEFDPPVQFERKTPPEEILAYIQERTTLTPENSQHWPVTGKNLALGLTNIVYACPICRVLEALVEHKSSLTCSACEQSWTVDTTNQLHSLDEDSSLSVTEAMHKAQAAFSETWVQDTARYEAEGIIMESEPLTLMDQSGVDGVEIATGQLQLTETELRMIGTQEPWSLPLSKLRLASVEMTRKLWLTTQDRVFEPVMPQESVLKWLHAIQHWKAAAES